MPNYDVEKLTTVIAKRMAREAGYPTAMWELFLQEAYDEYFHGSSQPTTAGQV
jgi:hypothetical protein